MNNEPLIKFLNKTSRIFDSLAIVENKEEIVKHLVASLLLNFSRIISQDEKIAPYLTDFSTADDADPNKLFEYLNSKNVNYQGVFISAQKETLESFLSELQSDLDPDKVEELRKIISE